MGAPLLPFSVWERKIEAGLDGAFGQAESTFSLHKVPLGGDVSVYVCVCIYMHTWKYIYYIYISVCIYIYILTHAPGDIYAPGDISV